MQRYSTLELREKEVINVCDGSKLGHPTDFEFNVYEGVITAIVIPRAGGLFGMFRGEDIVIPWDRIERIGTDAILVRMSDSELGLVSKDRRGRGNSLF